MQDILPKQYFIEENGWLFGKSAIGCVIICAKVAELVDALDLGSSGVTRESSSLSFRNQFIP